MDCANRLVRGRLEIEIVSPSRSGTVGKILGIIVKVLQMPSGPTGMKRIIYPEKGKF